MSILAEQFKQKNITLWQQCINHRFVNELFAGTIADDVMAHYLVQDYQFCDSFLKLMAAAVQHCPTMNSRLIFARQLAAVAGEENSYFIDSFNALNVPQEQREKPQLTEATQNFNHIMLDACQSNNFAAILAVLLVAEWLYLAWAQSQNKQPANPVHHGWITVHNNPQFVTWVNFLLQEFEQFANNSSDKQTALTFFDRSLQAEKAFFDSAYKI